MGLAVLFGMLGDAADALYVLSGLLFLTALCLFLSHLKVWGRFRLPKMEPMFRKGRGKWDPITGRFGK